jgi:hypothetical protein
MKDPIHIQKILALSGTTIDDAIAQIKRFRDHAKGLTPHGAGPITVLLGIGSILHMRAELTSVKGSLLPLEDRAKLAEQAINAARQGAAEGNKIATNLAGHNLTQEELARKLEYSLHPEIARYALGASTGPEGKVHVGSHEVQLGGILPTNHATASSNHETIESAQIVSYDCATLPGPSIRIKFTDYSKTDLPGGKTSGRICNRIVYLGDRWRSNSFIPLAMRLGCQTTITLSSITSTSTYKERQSRARYFLENLAFDRDSNLLLSEEIAKLVSETQLAENSSTMSQ